MKNLYLLFFCFLTFGSQAQVRITAENSPQIGNRLVYQLNNTLKLDPGSPGPGQFWDFSHFSPQSQEQINVVAPINIPGRDSFPKANLVFALSDGVSYSFALRTDSAFFSLGSFINTGDSSNAIFTVLKEPRKEIQYPSELGTRYDIFVENERSFGEVFEGTILLSKEEEMIISVADAEGILKLPQGEFPALRIKQNRNRLDSNFLVTDSTRQFINATSTRAVTYEWYTESIPGPLLSIDQQNIGTNNPITTVLDLENSRLDTFSGTPEIPIADFNSILISESTYFFIDQSQNQPTSWFWDFGDGNTSPLPNVQHQYQQGGSYEACLIVSNSAGSDTSCQTLVVERLRPLAAFSYQQADNGLVEFQNLSEDSNSFLWDFGDGSNSVARDPVHQYAQEGLFKACLTANNSFGIDSSCQQIRIENILPDADFSFQSEGTGVFSFINRSSTNVDSLHWDFGDGNSSSVENPRHQYRSEGNFTVCLIAYNTQGSDTLCQTLTVNNLLPVADFSFEEIDFGLFSFTDKSQNAPESWHWQFGDGQKSSDQNPTYQYTREGSFSVQLMVENSFGVDTSQQTLEVSGLQTSAGFDIDSIGQGLFQFINLSSSNSTQFSWNFGDGNTSMEENPSHQYQQEGFYTVCLAAANDFTSDTLCTTVEAINLIPHAAFTIASFEGDSIQLMDNSVHFPTEWLWTFGDGDSSRIQHPGHRYTSTGSFEVCLRATNRFGQDTSCQIVEIILVGTQSEWMKTFIAIGPNPFQDQLQLIWSAPQPDSQWQYRISNVLGNTIREGQLLARQTWATGSWPAGAYWLQLKDVKRNQQLSIPIIKN